MINVKILIGMIASGKSTYARGCAREGALVICHDDLTEMLHAEYRYEQESRDIYRMMEDSLLEIAVNFNKDVVIDRTHLTRESRSRWTRFHRVTMQPVSFTAVVFPFESPEVHAKRRFEHDSRGRSYEEWLQVANHHHNQWKQGHLGGDEGFSEIVKIESFHVYPDGDVIMRSIEGDKP